MQVICLSKAKSEKNGHSRFILDTWIHKNTLFPIVSLPACLPPYVLPVSLSPGKLELTYNMIDQTIDRPVSE